MCCCYHVRWFIRLLTAWSQNICSVYSCTIQYNAYRHTDIYISANIRTAPCVVTCKQVWSVWGLLCTVAGPPLQPGAQPDPRVQPGEPASGCGRLLHWPSVSDTWRIRSIRENSSIVIRRNILSLSLFYLYLYLGSFEFNYLNVFHLWRFLCTLRHKSKMSSQTNKTNKRSQHTYAYWRLCDHNNKW